MIETTIGKSTDGSATDGAVIVQRPPNTLNGNLVFDNGLPAAGITVRLYGIGFAGQDTKLGEVTSNAQGAYSFSYAATPPTTVAQPNNLQVRAVNAAGSETTISGIVYNAAQSATLNLVVPSAVQPLAPEYQRLSADMEKSIGGVAKLSEAQESTSRQDLTLLNRSTNWDARLVALAATAAQQAAVTGLSQDVLYSLYRVGLPTDPLTLASVPSATVEQALTKASQSGIVSYNPQQITAATAAFQNFSSKHPDRATARDTRTSECESFN